MAIMTNPIIYTSEHLRTTPKTACVAEAIYSALDRLHVEHRELKNTNDYWCRDYMPVRLSDDGTYARYNYFPDYLTNNESKQKYITNQQDACKDLDLFAPCDMDIVFDGGNYVRCGNKVVMTDKILSENPQWPVHDLFQHLRDVLRADIVLLPWDMEDPCGHTDGMVAPISEDKILLNCCWLHSDKAFHKRLLKILEAHFEVVVLDYAFKENKDSWCYLNYLQVPGGILLPCISKNADCENDVVAVETFSRLFPHSEIIPVYALPLIKDGGAIHCVTWEYIGKKDDSAPFIGSL